MPSMSRSSSIFRGVFSGILLSLSIILMQQKSCMYAFQASNTFARTAVASFSATANLRSRLFVTNVPYLDRWVLLPDSSIVGTIYNSVDPNITNGSVISTSPLKDPEKAIESALVETWSGSKYLLMNASALTADKTENNSLVAERKGKGDDVKILIEQVKEAGISGTISYAFWELAFWALSVPICFYTYRQIFGHWPDLSNGEDLRQLGTEAFAFVNVARFAVPLRIGLALSTAPWIQKNVVDKIQKPNR